jgi:hypothetical protein
LRSFLKIGSEIVLPTQSSFRSAAAQAPPADHGASARARASGLAEDFAVRVAPAVKIARWRSSPLPIKYLI